MNVDRYSRTRVDHSITDNRQFFVFRSWTKSWIPTSRTTDTVIATTITMDSMNKAGNTLTVRRGVGVGIVG